MMPIHLRGPRLLIFLPPPLRGTLMPLRGDAAAATAATAPSVLPSLLWLPSLKIDLLDAGAASATSGGLLLAPRVQRESG